MEFLNELASRSYVLYAFGWVCIIGVIVTGVLSITTSVQVLGINAWVKPFKFFLSSVIFVWTMGWFVSYLNQKSIVSAYVWVVVLVLAFELFWITFQAARGELSHFNISSSFNSMMFSLMGVAISIMTLFTLVIGILFFKDSFPHLPITYLWGIRLGIICFVIFAFQGGVMGAQMSHTIGAPDGGEGLKLLNWSIKHGDLRIAHFAGMHALQVLPLAGYYLFNSTKYIIIFSIIYFGICMLVFVQALMKIPLIKG